MLDFHRNFNILQENTGLSVPGSVPDKLGSARPRQYEDPVTAAILAERAFLIEVFVKR